MKDHSKDFGPFDGKVWLNCASEGAIPQQSVKAAQEAISWKVNPVNLTNRRFSEVPAHLKKAIGRLMNVAADDVILGNSATYGIHLLANGLPLKRGEDIILMQNDFPTDILPWLWLEKKGVTVRQIKPQKHVLSPEEVRAAIVPSTRVVCLSHVHTFSGHVLDIEQIGAICRQHKIIFVVNFSQSLGTRPIDLSKLPVDAMTTAGFKWLLGPYGTGFCWMRPEIRHQLEYHQSFWLNTVVRQELEGEGPLTLLLANNAARYDVFGTANFFNFCPLTASINYLLEIGMEEVYRHNDALVEKLIAGLTEFSYEFISPSERSQRSNLVVFSHPDRQRNAGIFQKLIAQGIYLANWKWNLRAAPHIFNTEDDIERLLKALRSMRDLP